VGRVSVVRDRAEDLRKVIALVQDGAKTGESREHSIDRSPDVD